MDDHLILLERIKGWGNVPVSQSSVRAACGGAVDSDLFCVGDPLVSLRFLAFGGSSYCFMFS